MQEQRDCCFKLIKVTFKCRLTNYTGTFLCNPNTGRAGRSQKHTGRAGQGGPKNIFEFGLDPTPGVSRCGSVRCPAPAAVATGKAPCNVTSVGGGGTLDTLPPPPPPLLLQPCKSTCIVCVRNSMHNEMINASYMKPFQRHPAYLHVMKMPGSRQTVGGCRLPSLAGTRSDKHPQAARHWLTAA